MNQLVPAPGPPLLPAPPWFVDGLLIFAFMLHVVVVDLLLGGAMVACWAAFRAWLSPGGDRATWRQALAGDLARVVPIAAAFAIALGVAPLLFVQLAYGQFFLDAVGLMSWPWPAVAVLLALAYAWVALVLLGRAGSGRQALLAGLVAAAGLAATWTMSANAGLMLRPEVHDALASARAAGLHFDWVDPARWPRFLHVVIGALAVAGLAVAAAGRMRARIDPPRGEWTRRAGTRLFGWAVAVQAAVGAWFVWSLPPGVRGVFLDASSPDAWLLAAGLLFALVAVLAVGRSVSVATAASMVAIADMVIVRQRVRAMMLMPYFEPQGLPGAPSPWVLVAFVAALVAGLVAAAALLGRMMARSTALGPTGSAA